MTTAELVFSMRQRDVRVWMQAGLVECDASRTCAAGRPRRPAAASRIGGSPRSFLTSRRAGFSRIETPIVGISGRRPPQRSARGQDEFHDIGAHPLTADQVTTTLCSEFGVDMNFRRQFELPTIERLAGIVDVPSLRAAGGRGSRYGDREEIEL
jgi:hypothetical protein